MHFQDTFYTILISIYNCYYWWRNMESFDTLVYLQLSLSKSVKIVLPYMRRENRFIWVDSIDLKDM